jgi:predicted MPP superfamily phosphohydrolase
MKLVAIGDIHGHDSWKQIVDKEHDADQFVFVGDYFDSFTVKGLDQINNFLDIIEFKKQSKVPVVMLIGNHDYHYYPGIEDSGTSGYQTLMAPSIQAVINDNKQCITLTWKIKNKFNPHKNDWGNDLWEYSFVDTALHIEHNSIKIGDWTYNIKIPRFGKKENDQDPLNQYGWKKKRLQRSR